MPVIRPSPWWDSLADLLGEQFADAMTFLGVAILNEPTDLTGRGTGRVG